MGVPENDWHRRPEYPWQVGGLEICTAVIDGGARTPEQLASWLAQHGRPATQPYRPPARCRHARETPRRLHANSGMTVRCMLGIGARPRNLVTAVCHFRRLAVVGGGCSV